MSASPTPAHPWPCATILRDPSPADAPLGTSWKKEYAIWVRELVYLGILSTPLYILQNDIKSNVTFLPNENQHLSELYFKEERKKWRLPRVPSLREIAPYMKLF